jgi:hypothetical protein
MTAINNEDNVDKDDKNEDDIDDNDNKYDVQTKSTLK